MIIPHSRPLIDQDDMKAVAEVLASGKLAQGEKVKEFEDAVARFVGKKYGVAVSSGTSALHLALLGLGVGVRDEVVMPSYVCSSPYMAIRHAEATAKIADIEHAGFNLSAASVKKQLSPKTRALIVPHMFGTPANLDELLDLGVPVIEDCAQALGAEYKGRQVGSLSVLSVFSFYATKMITTGEGGMVLTDDVKLYKRIADMRDYDRKPLTPVKYNCKMTDIQAALGLSQLRKLPRFIQRRRHIASVYDDRFSELGASVPVAGSNEGAVCYRYVLRVQRLEQTRDRARSKGITCERPVFRPLNKELPMFDCPNSDRAFDQALSIPLYPSLSKNEIEYLLKAFGTII